MNNAYVGFIVDCPAAHDPHITVAFIPGNEEKDPRGYPIDEVFGRAYELAGVLHKHVENKFPVDVSGEGVRLYGVEKNIRVLEVILPEQVHELVMSFRSLLFVRGVKYSLAFPFRPHITIGEEMPEPDAGTTYLVTGIFVDNGEQRHILHLK